MLLRLISYLTEVKSICLTSRSFKFRCHPIVINLAEVEGSANGRHRFVFFLSSWSNRELKIFMGEVIPSSKPPSASPPAFSHPSLCVDVKRQPWGSQTQTMWSLRGPAEDLPTTFLPNLPNASCLCSRFVVSDISLSLFFFKSSRVYRGPGSFNISGGSNSRVENFHKVRLESKLVTMAF